MTPIRIVFFLFLLPVTGVAQDAATMINPVKRNTIYAEVFGQGFFGSVNYDRLLRSELRATPSFSAGFVFAPKSVGFGDGMYLGLPVSYNWLLGKKKHHLESGLGFTFLATQDFSGSCFDNFYTYLSPKIGYRYQRPGGGLFFRATITPMIAFINVSTYGGEIPLSATLGKNAAGMGFSAFPWPGMSVGYSF